MGAFQHSGFDGFADKGRGHDGGDGGGQASGQARGDQGGGGDDVGRGGAHGNDLGGFAQAQKQGADNRCAAQGLHEFFFWIPDQVRDDPVGHFAGRFESLIYNISFVD